MVVKLSCLLVIMSLVGIRLGVGVRIKIRDFYVKTYETKTLGIEVSTGSDMMKASNGVFEDPTAEFKCLGINEFVMISDTMSLKTKNNLSFNIATDSNEFRKIKNNEESFEWEPTDNLICFVIGSWSPFGKDDIELYFKFLKGVRWIEDIAVVYLRIMVSDGEVTSSLLFPSRNLELKEESLKQKLNKGVDLNDRDLRRKIDDNFEIIFITYTSYHQLVVGNLVCELKNSKEVYLQLENTLIVRKSDGIFNMPFLSSRVEITKAEEAMMKFGKQKPIGHMETEFGGAKCTEKGIHFVSEENVYAFFANNSEHHNILI